MKNSQSKFSNKKSGLGPHSISNSSSGTTTGGCCCGSKFSEEVDEISVTEAEEK